ncbi:hypothetical protein TSAR_001761 [Trichomalopsis sarcophagae]|uniref:Uncharacterized protein n=1 Tax=Trichomalopsis sarcophagae TaxID=543379 RepID=A0A232EI58_9HYME|nr:hypothetical protein TSAR_001761 [Trichomalopsis sarcophagae]
MLRNSRSPGAQRTSCIASEKERDDGCRQEENTCVPRREARSIEPRIRCRRRRSSRIMRLCPARRRGRSREEARHSYFEGVGDSGRCTRATETRARSGRARAQAFRQHR